MDEMVEETLLDAEYPKYKRGQPGFSVGYFDGGLVVWAMGDITYEEGDALVRQYQGVLQAAGFKINYVPQAKQPYKVSCLSILGLKTA